MRRRGNGVSSGTDPAAAAAEAGFDAIHNHP
jgi:hypothetical protein